MYYHHHTGVLETEGLVVNGCTMPRDSAGSNFVNNRGGSFTPQATFNHPNAAPVGRDYYQTTPGLQGAGGVPPPLFYHPHPTMAASMLGVIEEAAPTYPYSPHHYLHPFYHPQPTMGAPLHPHLPMPTPSAKKKRVRTTKEKPPVCLESTLTRSGSRSKPTKLTHAARNGIYDTSPLLISRSPPYVAPFSYLPPSSHNYEASPPPMSNPSIGHPYANSYWTPPPSLDYPNHSVPHGGQKLNHHPHYSSAWSSGFLAPNPPTPMYQPYLPMDQIYSHHHPYHRDGPLFPAAPDNEPLNLCRVETATLKQTPPPCSIARRDIYHRPSPTPALYLTTHNYAPHPSPHPTYILQDHANERHSPSAPSSQQPPAVIIATQILSHMVRSPKASLRYGTLSTPSNPASAYSMEGLGGTCYPLTSHHSGTTTCSYIRTLLEKGAPYTYMYQKNGIPNVVPNYPFPNPAQPQPYNASFDLVSHHSTNHNPKYSNDSSPRDHFRPILHRPYESFGLKKFPETDTISVASCSTAGSSIHESSLNPSLNGIIPKHAKLGRKDYENASVITYRCAEPSTTIARAFPPPPPPTIYGKEPSKASFHSPTTTSGPTTTASLFDDMACPENRHNTVGILERGRGQGAEVAATTLFDASLYRTRKREEEEEEEEEDGNESGKGGGGELFLGSCHSSRSSSPLDDDFTRTHDPNFGFVSGATMFQSTPEASNHKVSTVNSILSGSRLNNQFKSSIISQLVKSRLFFNESPRRAFESASTKIGTKKPRSSVFSYTEYSGSEEDDATIQTIDPTQASSFASNSGKRFYEKFSKPTIMVHLALDLLVPRPAINAQAVNDEGPDPNKKIKLSPPSPSKEVGNLEEFGTTLITKIIDRSNRHAFHNRKGLTFLTDHLSPVNRPSWANYAKSKLSAQRRRLLSHRVANSLTQVPDLAVCHLDGPHFHSPACDRRTEHPNNLRCIECCNVGSQTLNETTMPSLNDFKKLVPNKASGETILHTAARRNLKDICLYLIQSNEYDINQKENAGYTALQEACLAGSKDSLCVLLRHGADPNCCLPDGTRPLHDAIEMDDISMVKLLLSFGADPTLKTYVGKSCLDYGKSPKMKAFLKKYIALYSNTTNLKSVIECATVTEDKILSQRAEMEETLPKCDTHNHLAHNSLTFEISDEPFIKTHNFRHNGKNINAVRLIDLSNALNYEDNMTALLEAHPDLKKHVINVKLCKIKDHVRDGDGLLQADYYVMSDWANKKLPNVSTVEVDVNR